MRLVFHDISIFHVGCFSQITPGNCLFYWPASALGFGWKGETISGGKVEFKYAYLRRFLKGRNLIMVACITALLVVSDVGT